MTASIIILGIVIVYVLATILLGLYTKRFSKSSDKYMMGGKSFGPFIIGV
jgi:SSS family solute:Na+ symporter